MNAVALGLIIALSVGVFQPLPDDEAASLRRSFSNLYESLRAQGGVDAADHPSIESLRDRVSSFNRRHLETPTGLAMELQLSEWLDDPDRVYDAYERLVDVTGDPQLGLAWMQHFTGRDDRRRVGEIFSRLSKTFPDDVLIRVGWAEFFKTANHYARAIEILEATSIDPMVNPEAAVVLSDCLFAEHRFDEAVTQLTSIPTATLASSPALAAQVETLLTQSQDYLTLWAEEQDVRSAEAAADDLPRAELVTARGRIVVELFENEAPNTVANFLSLSEAGFYEGTRFHRVLPNFMAQGGDPNTLDGADGEPGQGGPGYRIPDEHDREGARHHFTGTLAMANSGTPNSGGSQFYITHTPTAHLNGKHTVFGRVIEGLDVARSIEEDDELEVVNVLRKRGHDYTPQTLLDVKTTTTASPTLTPTTQPQ